MIIDQETVQKYLNRMWPGWRITGRLGAGTYGAVFEIQRENLSTGRAGSALTSALKVLYIETETYEDDIDRDGSLTTSLLLQNDFPGMDSQARGRYNHTSRLLSDGMSQNSLSNSQREKPVYRPVSGSMITEFVNSVSSEINAMIELKGHPHIVSIEDYQVDMDDQSCLIMIRMEELRCLSKSIREGLQTFTREETIRIGIDICKALELCEKRNIIHRDIKPSNIFFSEATGYKLGDFGISRTMDSIYESTFMSGIGTPSYIAPEVYAGRKYNNTADIYSLGMVLYQLMNDSCLPFIRENLINTGERRGRESFLRRMNGEKLNAPSGADEELAQVILKACSYSPSERFSTASEFRSALEKCLPAPIPDPPVDDGKKYNVPLLAGLGILAAVVIFLTGFFLSERLRGEKELSLDNPPSESLEETQTVTAGNELAENDGAVDREDLPGEITDTDNTDDNVTADTVTVDGVSEDDVTDEGVSEDSLIEEDVPGDNVTADDVLVFSDPALEKAIRQELKLGDDDVLTRERALEVESLTLTGGGKDESDKITDLTGLSAFQNITELNLQTNHITNIEELASLKKLRKLKLESNDIGDLSPLQDLSELRKLEVAHNNISDLKPIMSLRKLEVLDVIDNGLSSIQGIGGMIKLNTLRIGQNHITDIEPVAELNDLTDLSFGHNEVEDISALYELPMLHVLTFNYNKVRDIGPVADMKELTWLEVKGNPIEDTSILDNLPASVKHLERD